MEEPTQPRQNKKPLAILATAAVLIVGGVIAFANGLFKPADTAPAPVTNDDNDTDTNGQGTQSTKYKNGVYTITETYPSPGGNEQFGLSFTISGDKVVSASFTPKPVSPVGKTLQDKFNAEFKQYVVGKSVDEISISVISGASLTSAAFMKAMANIKAQAVASL